MRSTRALPCTTTGKAQQHTHLQHAASDDGSHSWGAVRPRGQDVPGNLRQRRDDLLLYRHQVGQEGLELHMGLGVQHLRQGHPSRCGHPGP